MQVAWPRCALMSVQPAGEVQGHNQALGLLFVVLGISITVCVELTILLNVVHSAVASYLVPLSCVVRVGKHVVV